MMGLMTPHQSETSPDSQGVTGGSTATFTMREAADVAGVSVSTLRRRRTELEDAGAVISTEGWKVPMTALIATGLIKTEGPGREEPPQNPAHDETAQDVEELLAEITGLKEQVAEWRRRAEVAEAISRERGSTIEAMRLSAETERMALRMITSGQGYQGSQNGDHAAHHGQVSAERDTPSGATPEPNVPRHSNDHEGVSPQVSHPDSDTPSAGSTRRKGFFGRLFS